MLNYENFLQKKWIYCSDDFGDLIQPDPVISHVFIS